MDLEYRLGEGGWATALVRADGDAVEMVASYVHDSLLNLAESALRLGEGSPETAVVLMDEPGEHHLVLCREGDTLSFEVRWFGDWASWGLIPPDRYDVVLRGETTVRRYRHQVLNVLWTLSEAYTAEEYRERWVQADFPEAAYARLREG